MPRLLSLLDEVCAGREPIAPDTELLDSGLLDSLAMMELLAALADMGTLLEPTRMPREAFRNASCLLPWLDGDIKTRQGDC